MIVAALSLALAGLAAAQMPAGLQMPMQSEAMPMDAGAMPMEPSRMPMDPATMPHDPAQCPGMDGAMPMAGMMDMTALMSA